MVKSLNRWRIQRQDLFPFFFHSLGLRERGVLGIKIGLEELKVAPFSSLPDQVPLLPRQGRLCIDGMFCFCFPAVLATSAHQPQQQTFPVSITTNQPELVSWALFLTREISYNSITIYYLHSFIDSTVIIVPSWAASYLVDLLTVNLILLVLWCIVLTWYFFKRRYSWTCFDKLASNVFDQL